MRLAPLLVVFLLAGCAKPFDLDIEVTDAAVVPGHCISHGDPEGSACHILTVHVDNGEGDEAELRAWRWSLVDAKGAVWKDPIKQGPDAVQAGGQADLVLHFNTDAGIEPVTLRFQAPLRNQTVETALP